MIVKEHKFICQVSGHLGHLYVEELKTRFNATFHPFGWEFPTFIETLKKGKQLKTASDVCDYYDER